MKLFIGDINSYEAKLRDEEQHHILNVLRMTAGEEIYITDGKGNLVRGNINISGKKIDVDIQERFDEEAKSEYKLHIAIAPTKNIDRFEFFVEKSVELGITEITPIICKNSERKILKIDKIQKQIENACKQSLKVHFPIINPLTPIKEFYQKINQNVYVAHCYKEYEKVLLNDVLDKVLDPIILIGPEGDFSKKEIEELYEHKVKGIDLGRSRLRTETAGIFVSAAFYYKHFY